MPYPDAVVIRELSLDPRSPGQMQKSSWVYHLPFFFFFKVSPISSQKAGKGFLMPNIAVLLRATRGQ